MLGDKIVPNWTKYLKIMLKVYKMILVGIEFLFSSLFTKWTVKRNKSSIPGVIFETYKYSIGSISNSSRIVRVDECQRLVVDRSTFSTVVFFLRPFPTLASFVYFFQTTRMVGKVIFVGIRFLSPSLFTNYAITRTNSFGQRPRAKQSTDHSKSGTKTTF